MTLGILFQLSQLIARFRAPRPAPGDDGYCHCPDPLLDADVGAVGSSDDDANDWCWLCRKPLPE